MLWYLIETTGGVDRCEYCRSFDVTSSIVGRTKVSRFTSSLSFFKSMQVRTFPNFFITGTIGARHDVGLMMGTITPAACRRSSVSFTLGCSGTGTRLASLRAYCSAPPLNTLLTYWFSVQTSSVIECLLKLVNFENEAHAAGYTATQKIVCFCTDDANAEVE